MKEESDRNVMIFVKGREKVKLLKSFVYGDDFFRVHFSDLSNIGCPKYTPSSKIVNQFPKCQAFCNYEKHKYCTESKIRFFQQWYNEKHINT
jgi:hypothetical protein